MLDDMTDTTASVFLGMTLACARCHDHKFDAISQKDYYRFQALFAADRAEGRRAAGLAARGGRSRLGRGRAPGPARPGQEALSAIEKPYLAALLKGKLDTLPAEVRKALATDPEERTAAQEDLLARYAKDMKVTPAAMESAMTPADRRAWTELGGEMKGLTESLPPAPPPAAA